MLIIGERINASREPVKRAIENKDTLFIKNEAKMQLDAGAHAIDVNCGTSMERESDDMAWLVRTLQEDSPVRLCIDSPDPKVIENALKLHKGRAFVNSISAEKSRYEKILPLMKKYNCDVVALTMDEKGVPATAQDRFEIATIIMEIASRFGVTKDNLYFDGLVRPVSTEQNQPREFLESIRLMKELGFKTIGGVSNVSFGLPERSLINRTFLAMAVAAGLDAAIIDPTDRSMMQAVWSSESVLGRDQYSMNYIRAFREGRLTSTGSSR